MVRNWIRLGSIPLLLTSLWIAGCGDQRAPADALLGPDAAAFAKGGNGYGKAVGHDKQSGADKGVKRGHVMKELKQNGTFKEWKVVRGKLPRTETEAEGVIGPEGGVLATAGHVLEVPAGAVAQPTDFKIKASRRVVGVEGADTLVAVQVSLKATYLNEDDLEVNVGKAGFAVPVTLRLSYAWAADAVDPAQATILWVTAPDQGEEVSERTYDSAGQWVVGRLHHFSDYLLAMP